MKHKLLIQYKYLLRLAIFGALAVGLSMTATAQDDSEDSEEDLEELEPFVMTGSRIKRTDLETVSPVITMTPESISESGFNTIGDAIRALPFNNGQSLTPTDSGTSFTPGVSTVNLRGLGNNNTLVLINGRRAAPYAVPGFSGFQQVFDLNSLPAAAIKSVQIQKDGASAIYGSDAVAGVLNVQLRSDYEGLASSVRIGNYTNTDGFFKSASIVAGTSTAKTSLVFAANWQEQNSVFARDLPYSVDADKTSDSQRERPWAWIPEDNDAVLTEFGSKDAYMSWLDNDIDFGDPTDQMDGYAYSDNRSSRGIPGYVNTESGQFTFDSPTDNPTVDGATPGSNKYNYQETNGLFPSYTLYSYYSRVTHQLTDNVRAIVEASFSRSESDVSSAAAPVDIENSHGLDSADPMYIPAENPYNPWDEDIFSGRRRLVELPNRTNKVTSDTPRMLVALEGDINEDWSWQAGYLYSKNSVQNISVTASDNKLQQSLLGLTRNGDGSLAWDPSTAAEDRVYFNWFGINEQAFADFLTIYNPTTAWYEMQSYDFQANGVIAELPGGSLGVAMGIERRLEDFGNVKTDLNATGMILAGSEGVSSFGKRDVNAAYVEFAIPVIEQLEIQLAGRYEDYSDSGIKSQIRPKIGAKYHPTNWLLFRASFSEAFKAPDLPFLYTASQRSFSSFQIIDPVTGTEIDQVQTVTAGNPDLKPELTDSYYAGVVIEPTIKWLKDFTFAVDYFQFTQVDLLAQLSDYFGYEEFINGAFEGDPLFDGKVVRDPVSNEVLYLLDGYVNISNGVYEGIDFEITYRKETQSMGDFAAKLQITKLLTQTIDGDSTIGGYLTPEYRGTFSIGWNRGDWSINSFTSYIDSRQRNLGTWWYTPEDNAIDVVYKVDRQIITNLQTTYSGFWDLDLTVGMNNVLNDNPPLDVWDASGSTPGVNSLEPRFIYFEVAREF